MHMSLCMYCKQQCHFSDTHTELLQFRYSISTNSVTVFMCEAAQCYSHTSVLKNAGKYPKNDTTMVARWKRLIWQGGKVKDGNVIDELNETRRSRLCSRHFDPADIDMWGNTAADPKHLEWNN